MFACILQCQILKRFNCFQILLYIFTSFKPSIKVQVAKMYFLWIIVNNNYHESVSCIRLHWSFFNCLFIITLILNRKSYWNVKTSYILGIKYFDRFLCRTGCAQNTTQNCNDWYHDNHLACLVSTILSNITASNDSLWSVILTKPPSTTEGLCFAKVWKAASEHACFSFKHSLSVFKHK